MKQRLQRTIRHSVIATAVVSLFAVPALFAASQRVSADAAPVVSSVSPASESTTGGDTITVTGSNFVQGSKVRLNVTSVTTTFVSATTLTFVAPSWQIPDVVDVSVDNPDGQTATLAQSFTYASVAPTVTSVTPSAGPLNGRQAVTVNGANFSNGILPISSVSVTTYFGCGLYQSNGYCWGLNSSGQLGNGTTTTPTGVVPISTTNALAGKTLKTIATHSNTACAIASDSQAYCWGTGTSGQIGNNASASVSSPTAVYTGGGLSGKVIAQIGVGDAFACALTNTSSSVYCWGNNSYGQLGNNSTTTSAVPVLVTNTGVLSGKTLTSLSVGERHACVLANDGTSYCWGYNADGEGGDGTSLNNKVPTATKTNGALAGKSLVSISAGVTSTCAVDSAGVAYCWGASGNGLLGTGATNSANTLPTPIDTSGVLSGKTVRSVSVGANHACALASDYQSYCWGINSKNQLGNNSTTTAYSPVATDTSGVPSGDGFMQVSAGGKTSCEISSENILYCWGAAPSLNQAVSSTVPQRSADIATGVFQLQLGGSNLTSLQLQSPNTATGYTSPHDAGSVSVVATNADAKFGTLSNAYAYAAAPTVDALSPASGYVTGGDTVTVTGTGFTANSKVAVGAQVVATTYINSTTLTYVSPTVNAALTRQVSVIDDYGQTSSTTQTFTYQLAAPSVTSVTPATGPSEGGQSVTINGANIGDAGRGVKAVVAGNYSSCAIYASNDAYCVGNGSSGQLGNSTTTSVTSFTPIKMTGSLAGKYFKKLVSGASSNYCGISSDDQAYCWGANSYGQLGNGGTSAIYAPVQITSGGLASKTVRDLSMGNGHACAVASDAKAYCWGLNSVGELGINSTTNTGTPTAVYTNSSLSGKTVTSIVTTNQSTCALDTTGMVSCWGYNVNGQVGDGTTTQRNVPTAVSLTGAAVGKKFAKIYAGLNSVCGITTDGLIFCWGGNSNGQVGDGTTTNQSAPVPVNWDSSLYGLSAVSIAIANNGACALMSDGQVYCWGNSTSGLLGNGTTGSTIYKTPTLIDMSGVLNGHRIMSVSMGNTGGCVVADNDQMYCWGANSFSQLGDQTTNTAYSPVASIPASIAPTVLFDQSQGTATTAPTSTQIQTTTPAHSYARVPVSIKNYDGQSATLANAYTYASPTTVTGVSPSSGLVSGGDTVTISGSNFATGMQVKVDGVDVGTVTVVNATTATFTVPAHAAPGLVNVDVIDTYGQDTTLTNGYTYRLPAPALTSVTPTSGTQDGGTTLTISGSGFVAKPGGGTYYTVTVGGTAASNVTYVDGNTLTATTPAHTTGTVDVTVGGTYVNSTTLAQSYTYLPSKFAFNNTALSLDTNEAGKLTIVAQDKNGNLATATQDITISLSSSSTTGQFARSLTEDTSTRWSYNSVVLPAGQSYVDVYYRDSISGHPTITGTVNGGQSFTQAETISSPYRLSVTGITNPIQAGVPSSVTVRVTDRNGNPTTGYTGSLVFTSSDAAAKFPANAQMTTADNGIKTFTNGVTMGTQGTYCVRVTDSADSQITGQQCSIKVNAPNTGTIAKLSIITPAQRVPSGSASAPITVQAQADDGTPIPVDTDTTIYLYSSSSTGTFSTDGSSYSSTKPLSVTIPAGSSSLNFYYKDATARTSTISIRDRTSDTGDNNGGDFGWKNASQSIVTGVSPASTMNVSGPGALIKNQQGTYTVELDDDSGNPVTAVNDVTILIGSSTPTGQFYDQGSSTPSTTTPYQLTVPAGSTSASFSFADSTLSSGTTNTVLSLTDGRSSTVTDRLHDASKSIQIVNSYPTAVSLTPASSSATAGQPVGVTVGLVDGTGTSAPATGSTSVRLSAPTGGQYSLTASPFTPVTSVTFNQGDATKQLYYRGTAAGANAISAAATGLTSGSSTITVVADVPAVIKLTQTSTLSLPIATRSTAIGYQLYDQYDNPATASSALSLYPYSSDNDTVFYDSPTGAALTQLNVPAGSGSGQFYLMDSAFHATDSTITLSDSSPKPTSDTGITDASFALHVVSQPVASIQFTSGQQQVAAGALSAPISLQLLKADGTPAIQDGSTSVSLGASQDSFVDATGTPISSVQIAKNGSTATAYYISNTAGMVQLTATMGGVHATQSLEVTPGAVAKTVFDTNAQRIAPNQPSGAIHVSFQDQYGNIAAVAGATSVALSSSCNDTIFSTTAGGQGITNLAVAAGDTGATFYVQGTTPGDCTLSLQYGALQAITQSLHINSYAVASIAFSGSEQTIKAGAASNPLHITLLQADGTPAYQDGSTAISLSSSDGSFYGSSALGLPIQSVSVAANGASADVYFSSRQVGDIQLQASIAGAANPAAQTIHVIGGDPADIRITSNQQTVAAGAPSSAINFTLRDRYGNTATNAAGYTVSLSSDCSSGTFSLDATDWQNTTSVTVPAGQTGGAVYYKANQAGTCNVTFSGAGASSAVQPITILSGLYAHALSISTAPGTYEKGQQVPVSVSLLDQNGNIVTAPTNTTVALTNNTGGSFDSPSVTIQAGTSTATSRFTANQSGTSTLTASGQSDPSLTPASTDVAIIEGAPSSLQMTVPSGTRAGQSVPVTISVYNSHNALVNVPTATTINLASTATSGYFTAGQQDSASQAVISVGVPAHQSSVTAYYTQTASGSTIVSSNSAGLSGDQAALQVTAANVASVQFMNDPYVGNDSLTVNTPAVYQLRLLDQYGNIATTDSDLILHATASDNGTLSNNGNVRFVAGSATASFTYTQSHIGSFTVSVADPAHVVPTITQDGQYGDAGAIGMMFTTDPVSVERGGVTSAISLTLIGSDGQPRVAPSGGQPLTVSVPQADGLVSLSSSINFARSLNLRIPAGVSSISLYYRNDNAVIDGSPHSIVAASTFYGHDLSVEKPITVTYGQPTQLQFTTSRQTIQAGYPSSQFTVQQQNRYGQPVPASSAQTLYLTSSNAGTSSFADSKTNFGINTLTIQPGSSTASFYYQDDKVSTPQITVSDSLPVTPDVGLTNATQTVTVTKQTAARSVKSLLVTNVSDPQKAGTPSSLVVAALDADGFIVNDYVGTVTISSDDPTAIVPTTYTFVPADRGVHTFTNAVAFKTAGEKTVTARDQALNVGGEQQNITVTGANTSPVAKVAFLGQHSIRVAPNTVSQPIYVQLQDTSGSATAAPTGGYAIRVTADLAGALISTDGTTWSHQLVVTVPAGLTYASVYYKNDSTGDDTLHVSDWQGGVDSSAIANDNLAINIDDIYLTGHSMYMSRDVFGNYVAGPLLFSSQADGQITARVTNEYQSYLLSTGQLVYADWQSQWRQGVTLLDAASTTAATTHIANNFDVTTTAGSEDFFSTAKATIDSFDNPYSVVSLQNRVPVSPWRVQASLMGKSDDDNLVMQNSYYNNNVASSPVTVGYSLLPADATSDEGALAEWGSSSPRSGVATTLPLADSLRSGTYRIFVKTYAADGTMTAEALTAPFDYGSLATTTPSDDTNDAATTSPIEQGNGDSNGGDNGTGSSDDGSIDYDSGTTDEDGNAIPIKGSGNGTSTGGATVHATLSIAVDMLLVVLFAVILRDFIFVVLKFRQSAGTAVESAFRMLSGQLGVLLLLTAVAFAISLRGFSIASFVMVVIIAALVVAYEGSLLRYAKHITR